jgi:hypothetical protein
MAARHIQQQLTDQLDASAPLPANGAPAPPSSRVQRLVDYWHRKRGDRVMAARADIEPAEIKPLLPYLIIADVFADPVRVRYRLAGTAVCDAFGYNIAGRWLEDLDVNGGVPFWIEQYGRMVASRAPIFGQARGMLAGAELFRADWALLPLSSDGLRVDQCLEMEDWIKGSPTADYSDARIVWSVTALG